MSLIKVQALEDGHYGGYYRHGPFESEQGNRPGEIFEVEDAVYEVKDESGNPIYEVDQDGKKIPITDKSGNQKKDTNGRPMFKAKTASFFAPSWMKRVSDDSEVTYDHPPFQLPQAYRKKKQKTGPQFQTPVPSGPLPDRSSDRVAAPVSTETPI